MYAFNMHIYQPVLMISVLYSCNPQYSHLLLFRRTVSSHPLKKMSHEAKLTSAAAEALVPDLFPKREAITPAQIEAAINACLEVQRRAVSLGKRPFAACLLGPDNQTVLLTHQSVDQVNHAESSLARLAYCHYPKEYLWRCTLVSTWEPCAMCSCICFSDSSLFSGR
jgi:hypothetical protein